MICEFDMKTFATILFAVCVFSQLASSAEWDELTGDAINAIGSKLDANGKLIFSATSPTVMANVQVSPQEILAHVVHSTECHWSAGPRDNEVVLLFYRRLETRMNS